MSAKGFIVAMLLGATACGFKSSPPESRAVVEKYFEHVKQGSAKPAESLFSPESFTSPSLQDWLAALDRGHAKLGALQSFTVTVVNTTSFSGTNKSGVYTTFRCDVQFEKEQAVETFRVFQADGSETAKIIGHNVNSAGFI